MATIAERRIGAILGALVADAAAQPLHWVYDEKKLGSIVGTKEEVEFWQPSANPFYCIDTGKQTCYGDQAFVVLKSLVKCKGVDVKDMQKANYEMFGPESEYEDKQNAEYVSLGEHNKPVKDTYPIKRPWRHGSIKHFLKNLADGKPNTGSETDEQVDCVPRMVPVVAMYAGQPEMLDKVEEAVRVIQEFDLPIVIAMAAARILEQYILQGPCQGVVEKVCKELEEPGRRNTHDLDRAVAGQLREVLAKADMPHFDAVKAIRKD